MLRVWSPSEHTCLAVRVPHTMILSSEAGRADAWAGRAWHVQELCELQQGPSSPRGQAGLGVQKAWNLLTEKVLSYAVCSVAQSCPTLCNPVDCSLPGSSVHGDSPDKNTGMSCHALLQGIFATQGLNLSCGAAPKRMGPLSTQGGSGPLRDTLSHHYPMSSLLSSGLPFLLWHHGRNICSSPEVGFVGNYACHHMSPSWSR